MALTLAAGLAEKALAAWLDQASSGSQDSYCYK